MTEENPTQNVDTLQKVDLLQYSEVDPTKWQKVNPFETPQLNVDQLPKHNPERFENFVELYNEEKQLIGFTLEQEKETLIKFLFDNNDCFVDERGCFYDGEARPQGWMVYNETNNIINEYFYDMDGTYVPSGFQDGNDDQDQDDEYDEQDQQPAVKEDKPQI